MDEKSISPANSPSLKKIQAMIMTLAFDMIKDENDDIIEVEEKEEDSETHDVEDNETGDDEEVAIE